MMRKTVYTATLLALVVTVISCDTSKKYEEEEKITIADYITTHNITVNPDSHGIYYMEQKAGSGDLIRTGDSVGVVYTGKFLNGEEFDSNKNSETPFRFRVGSYYLIEGWSMALSHMKLGTSAQILLPSDLAYGSVGYGYYDYYGNYYTVIPGYMPLLFDIEVVELVRSEEYNKAGVLKK